MNIGPVPIRKARIADILKVAAVMSNMPVATIIGPRRTRHIMRVRQACYVVSRRMGHSLPQIGERIGDRDHSSVVHGIEAAGVFAERDPEFRQFIEDLEAHTLEVQANLAAANRKQDRAPRLVVLPKAPQGLARNDFRSDEQPDKWQHFGDNMIAGSERLRAAILEARAA